MTRRPCVPTPGRHQRGGASSTCGSFVLLPHFTEEKLSLGDRVPRLTWSTGHSQVQEEAHTPFHRSQGISAPPAPSQWWHGVGAR